MTETEPSSSLITAALDELRSQRPLFHSGADFQHSLAWTLQQQHPSARVRLETRLPTVSVTALDLMFGLDGKRIAIDLKYLVRGLQHAHGHEPLAVANQGAPDTRRYDVLKDTQRID